MNVKKLTITPLMSGCQSYETRNPSTEVASLLIKERLSHVDSQYNQTRPPRALRKLPKWLKSFVNPNTLVVKENKFNIEG